MENIERQYEQTSRRTGEALHELIQTYNFCMQRTLSKYGLYPGQPPLLFAIRDSENPTQNDLAAKLDVSKASVGVSLRRLEKAGFVKRVQDKKDTRCNRITLTKKGQEYVRWCEIDYDMLFTTLLENFSGDERERVAETIERMLKSLNGLRERMEL